MRDGRNQGIQFELTFRLNPKLRAKSYEACFIRNGKMIALRNSAATGQRKRVGSLGYIPKLGGVEMRKRLTLDDWLM